MQLTEVNIAGYRSMRDVPRLRLDRLNIVAGANGCGKTNLYRSLELLHAAAHGRLARTLLEEGGMPAVLWRGDRRKGPVRVCIEIEFDELDYQLQFGLPIPGQTMFSLDPEVKQERLRLTSAGKRIGAMERKNTSAWIRDQQGRRVQFSNQIASSESILSELREPERFPVLSMLRAEVVGWRFYHRFRTDAASPLRRPQPGVRTPILSPDGSDAAAALQTIIEVGDRGALVEAIGRAFPGASLAIECAGSTFSFGLRMPEFFSPLWQQELSDGMLQYLCLLAALLSPRPASFVVLNEPETSLHPDLLPALANLIVHASKSSQILVTTHSATLCRMIADLSPVNLLRMQKLRGESRFEGYSAVGPVDESDT